MSSKSPIAFPSRAAHEIPVLGQPFTFTQCFIPVNATLTCNCGGLPELCQVTIVGSVGAACGHCKKEYNVAFNPTSNPPGLQVLVNTPTPEVIL